MKIELRETKHLWITYNPAMGDFREIIIDEEKKDIRICDGHRIVKIRFKGTKIKDVLLNDIFVAQKKTACVCPLIGTEKECVFEGTLCSEFL